MTKTPTLDELKAAEVERAEAWKAKAEQIAALSAELKADMEAHPPETAVGERALAEVKMALAGGRQRVLERIRARKGVVVTDQGAA